MGCPWLPDEIQPRRHCVESLAWPSVLCKLTLTPAEISNIPSQRIARIKGTGRRVASGHACPRLVLSLLCGGHKEKATQGAKRV